MSTCSLRSRVHVAGHRWGLICSWSKLLRSSRAAEGEAMVCMYLSLFLYIYTYTYIYILFFFPKDQSSNWSLSQNAAFGFGFGTHRQAFRDLSKPQKYANSSCQSPGNNLPWNFWAFCLLSSSDHLGLSRLWKGWQKIGLDGPFHPKPFCDSMTVITSQGYMKLVLLMVSLTTFSRFLPRDPTSSITPGLGYEVEL